MHSRSILFKEGKKKSKIIEKSKEYIIWCFGNLKWTSELQSSSLLGRYPIW